MKTNSRVLTISILIIAMIAIFFIIYIGASLLIPLIIAIIISFAIISVSNFFHKLWLNKFISFTFSLISFLLIFWLIGVLINSNVQDIVQNSQSYQEKFVSIIKSFEDNLNSEGSWMNKLNMGRFINYDYILSKIDIPFIVSFFASWATTIFKSTGIIFFYTIFILLESRFFYKKIDLMFSSEWKDKVVEVIELIKKDVKAYFVIKTVVSLITAIVSYLIMLMFWLKLALFWAFLIFLLNYIPTIGSIVAVFFPVLFSIIDIQSAYITLWILILLAWVQITMWNIVEPRFMWNKLNLSPLVILISLIFWWALWWIVGMLLSVPIMVIINIILSHIKSTRPIAILLSEKGIIKTDFWNIKKDKKSVVKRIRDRLKK